MVAKVDIRSHDLHNDIPQSEKDRVSEYNAHYRDIKEAVETDFRNVTGLPDASIWRYRQRLTAFVVKSLMYLGMATTIIILLISVMLPNIWLLICIPVLLITVNITAMIYNHRRVEAVKAMQSKVQQKYIDIMNRRLELRPSYMPPVIMTRGGSQQLTLNDVFELYCDYMETVFMDIRNPSARYNTPLTIFDDTGRSDEDSIVINTIRYQDPQSIFFECDDGRQGMIDLKTREVFSPHFKFFYLEDNTK